MATSGTYTYFSVMDLVTTAYRRCNIPLASLTGQQLDDARLAMNDLFLRWGNRGINLWKISSATTTSVADTANYSIGSSSAPIIDVINVNVADSTGVETPLGRISEGDYQRIPDKTVTGKPTQFTTFRTSTGVDLYVYPTPPDATYTLKYHTLNYVQELAQWDDDLDLPQRMYPALLAGTAWLMAVNNSATVDREGRILKEGVDPQLRAELRADYVEVFQEAREEDRERASFYAIPWVGH